MFASVATRKSAGSLQEAMCRSMASVPPTKSLCSLVLAGHSGRARVSACGGFFFMASRGEDLGRLGHEMDPAENDDRVGAPGGGPGQVQAVAGKVGQFLDFAFLVIMGQEGRVVAGLEFLNFGDDVLHGGVPCFLCGG